MQDILKDGRYINVSNFIRFIPTPVVLIGLNPPLGKLIFFSY